VFHFFQSILSYHHCHSGALVKRDNPRLDWGNWAIGKPDSSGVILRGWPLQQRLTALSHIRNLHDMNTILNAITQQDCRLELVKNPEKDPQCISDGTHFPSIIYVNIYSFYIDSAAAYRPGGTVLRFSNESETTMELRSTRKRKATHNANTTDKNKENDPLDDGSAQPASKRRRSTDATHDSESQSLIEPISAPDQSQSLVEPISAPDQAQSLLYDTSSSGACGPTVPPTGSQVAPTCPGSSNRDSITALTSLGDKDLYTFPPEPLNVFSSVSLGDAGYMG
jgi:hypothetical protein